MKVTRRGKPNTLTAYRRHAGGCKGTQLCDCVFWCHGKVGGVPKRHSLNTRSEEAAKAEIRRMLNPDDASAKLVAMEAALKSVESAAADFLKAHTDSSSATAQHYGNFVNRFANFFTTKGATNLRDVTTEMVRAAQDANADRWKSVNTRHDALNVCRIWFNFCVEHKWITQNPAKPKSLSVKKSSDEEAAKKPFDAGQIERIREAIASLKFAGDAEAQRIGRARALALVLLQLASGQRISDSCFARRSDLDVASGMLDYRAAKTRRRLELAPHLPQEVVEALAALPVAPGDTFFFWPGDYSEAVAAFDRGAYLEKALPTGMFDDRIRQLKRLIDRILELAEVGGSAHCFRSTFAVNFLIANALNIFTLSKLLGHRDIKITQKHYLNLVPGYRQQLSQSVNPLPYFSRTA